MNTGKYKRYPIKVIITFKLNTVQKHDTEIQTLYFQ